MIPLLTSRLSARFVSGKFPICFLFGLLISGLGNQNLLRAQILESGPTHYYDFNIPGASYAANHGSGNEAPDFAPIYGLNVDSGMTISGAALFGSGSPVSSDYIDTRWKTNLYESWTIGFSINTGFAASGIHYLFGDSAAYGFACYLDYGSASFSITVEAPDYPGFVPVSYSGISLFGGHYIHISYDATEAEMKLFADSIPVASVSQPYLAINGWHQDPSTLIIGGFPGRQGMAIGSWIDEFRIYDYALSDSEVAGTAYSTFGSMLDAVDVAALAVAQPIVQAAAYSSSEEVRMAVLNAGTEDLDVSVSNLELTTTSMLTNALLWNTIVDTGILKAGQEWIIPIESNYDMSDSGTYQFDFVVDILGPFPDENIWNNISKPVLRQQEMVTFLPYRTRFDNFIAGGTDTAGAEGIWMEGWRTIPGAGATWTLEDANGLDENIPATGPLLDAGKSNRPGGNYALFSGTADAELISPLISLDSVEQPFMNYRFHAFGSAFNRVYTEVDSGTGWIAVDSVVGPQQSSAAEDWILRTVNLTDFTGTRVHIRFRGIAGTGPAEFGLDEVQIYNYYVADAAVSFPLIPEPGICGFSSTEDLGVVVQNNTAEYLTGFDIFVQQDGPITNSFSVNVGTLNIPPFEDARIPLEGSLDLSATGSYQVKAWIAIPGDTVPENDTISAPIMSSPAASIGSFPWTENFSAFVSWEDSPIEGDTLFDWVMVPGGYSGSAPAGPARWRWSEGFLPSWITGPTEDHTPDSEGFVYYYPGAVPFASSEVYCPCLDLRSSSNPVLDFWYHMFGANMGELSVRIVSDNSGETEVFELSGPQMDDNDSPWGHAVIDLTPWKDEVIRINFKGKRRELTSTYMSLDDISVQESEPNDIEVVAIEEPSYRCGMTRNHEFAVELRNNSLDTIFSIPLTLDIIGPDSLNVSEIASIALPPFENGTYTFTATADLGTHGDYQVRVWSDLGADLIADNDTTTLLVSNTPMVVSLPVEEDFEDFVPGAPGVYGAGWNGQWWVEQDSVQNTPLTGPINDHTPGGKNYMYVEADWADTFLELRSVCLEVDSSRPLYTSFWYYRHGEDLGRLDIDIYTGGKKVGAVGSINGEQHISEDLPWLREFVRLDQDLRANDLLLAFESRQTGVLSDHALDDIRIFYADSLDAEAFEIELLPGCSPDRTEVVVTVFNHGLDTLENIPVEVSYTGASSGSFNEIISGPITPFSEFFLKLDGRLDLMSGGTYEIRLSTMLPGDAQLLNDTVCIAYTVPEPVDVFPWQEDFESGQLGLGGRLPDGWAVFPERVPMWTMGQFETPTASTGPAIDHSPAGSIYAYLESTSPEHGGASRFLSPCLDLSSPDLPNPWMRYWFHMYGDQMGDLVVDVLTEDSAYLAVDVRTGELHGAMSEYTRVDLPLAAWAGELVQLRFRGFSGGDRSDMALDDISVFGATGTEAELVDAILETDFCEVPDNDELRLRIKNNSGVPISGFDVGFEIFGPAPQSYTENVGGFTIPAFDSAEYALAVNVSITEGGVHRLRPFVAVPGDTNPADDTLSWNYAWFPVPWFEDFESSTPGEPGVMANGWLRSPEDPENGWLPEASGEQNTMWTGPIMDHTTGSGNYIYLENVSFNPNVWQITSPCIQLDASIQSFVSFWYHRYGLDQGDQYLEVEYAEDLWDTIGILIGPGQFSELAPWGRFEQDISALGSLPVRFRISGVNGGLLSDMAVDDFLVGTLPSGINNSGKDWTLSISPNPASEFIRIQLDADQSLSARIIDLQGRVLWDGKLQMLSEPLDLKTYSPGIYQLQIRIEESWQAAGRFAVQR